jgi:hypothetical protein
MQIKPQPPSLNAQIKIHKDNEPIRLVVNNIYAPSYKVAKFLNKWLTDKLQLTKYLHHIQLNTISTWINHATYEGYPESKDRKAIKFFKNIY